MLFNSFEFLLLFLPLTLGVAKRLRRNAFLVWICIASCVFYAFAGHVWFLVPMAITTVLDFVVARRMARFDDKRARLPWLLVSLVCNLSLLAYFKYSGLFVDTVSALAAALSLRPYVLTGLSVILPAGISFYTFQTLSYVLDVYRGVARPEPNFWAYLAFVAFFPHLVAGPLTRHNQLIPQLLKASERGIQSRWAMGVSLFAVGLAKKVLIADRIAYWGDPLIAQVGTIGFVDAWLCAAGYAMQIYFDFSGYSDMAIGLGRLFDVELPQNFDRPYVSLDPSDFWRRWHITLSQWLRDYLYISLGGNRGGPHRTDFNLMLTMILGGLWHGASWTFAVWGAYHGLLLVVHRRNRHAWSRLPVTAQRAFTFVLVCIGWVFFRAKTFKMATLWLASMFGLSTSMRHVGTASLRLAMLVFLAGGIAFFGQKASTYDFSRMSRVRSASLGLVAAAAVILMNFSSRFLYFQF